MELFWKKTAEKPHFPTLDRDMTTDVLIIGGGIAGILCAYMLKHQGIDCILAEADEICSGITGNTTAKITLQHGLIYDRMIRRFGLSLAQRYVDAQTAALVQYRTICQSIECDYEEADSYVYSLDKRAKIEREVAALRRLGIEADTVKDIPLPFAIAGAARVSGQAQFHPLKFLYAIAEKLPIFEHSKVLELKGHQAVTAHAKITANKTVVATHFPFLNKHGSYFLKMYQHRSYVLALADAPIFEGMYVDEHDKGLSFRRYGDLLLLGGGSHRTGKKGGNWKTLEDFTARYYPSARVVSRFATQDCMTLDSMPYIGCYSGSTRDLFVATGFNKWGMSSSMVAAMLLCDLVQGKENRYVNVFSPSRSILRPQLALNTAESLLGLLTPTRPRCPHMGCVLKYNRDEHSWDCPCHGSRFTEHGELIDNPATDDRQ